MAGYRYPCCTEKQQHYDKNVTGFFKHGPDSEYIKIYNGYIVDLLFWYGNLLIQGAYPTPGPKFKCEMWRAKCDNIGDGRKSWRVTRDAKKMVNWGVFFN
jgi:uncharacterized protein (DUF2225 family)